MRFGNCNFYVFLFLALFGLIGLLPNTMLGQDQGKRESRITLLTASQGESDVASVFGHSALRVKGVNGAEDILYNFGTYSWDQPNFLLNFLRGRLLYSLSKQRYGPFLNAYHAEERSITEQTLFLTDQQEANILSALAKNYRAENREYLYEFFFDNCTTRLRDIISEGCAGDFTWSESTDQYTFRDLLHQYTEGDSWLTFGIDLLVGSRTDKLATQQEEMFLPDYLMNHLDNVRDASGNPIVSSKYKVLDFTDKELERKEKDTNWPLYLFGLFLLIEIFIFYRVFKISSTSRLVKFWDKFWFLILGIGGLLLVVMWLLTDHYTTKSNWNVLWMTPLYLGLVGKLRTNKIFNYIVIASLVLGGSMYLITGQTGNIAFLPIIGLVLLKVLRSLMQMNKTN